MGGEVGQDPDHAENPVAAAALRNVLEDILQEKRGAAARDVAEGSQEVPAGPEWEAPRIHPR